MKRKVIAIDIDDVIAASTEALRLEVNQKAGVNLCAKDYLVEGDYWGYYERVWASHGLEFKLADFDPTMIKDQSHVPLLPGADFAIGELSKHFDIIFITARDVAWEAATLKWLKRHFDGVFTSVHFAGSRHDAPNAKTKGQLARDLGANWLVDDSPLHCQSALEEGLEPILFGDYGWHYQKPTGVVHCKNWPAVLEYLDVKR